MVVAEGASGEVNEFSGVAVQVGASGLVDGSLGVLREMGAGVIVTGARLGAVIRSVTEWSSFLVVIARTAISLSSSFSLTNISLTSSFALALP